MSAPGAGPAAAANDGWREVLSGAPRSVPGRPFVSPKPVCCLWRPLLLGTRNSQGQPTRPESGTARAMGSERVFRPKRSTIAEGTPTLAPQESSRWKTRSLGICLCLRGGPCSSRPSRHVKGPPSARCLGRKQAAEAGPPVQQNVGFQPPVPRLRCSLSASPPLGAARCCACLEGTPRWT